MKNSKGKSRVLIGLQYGDEGKARVLDKIMDDADITARFNGGANAGHTLVVGDKSIALHMIPSGIFYPEMQLYVGSGCVVNPVKTNKEIAEIEGIGLSLEGRLHFAANASLVQPHHLVLDGVFGKGIGTTGNGIGPVYADRAQRAEGGRLKNLRVADFFANPQAAYAVVKENLEQVIDMHGVKGVNAAEEANKFVEETKKLEQYYCTDTLFLEKLAGSGKNVFFEGA
jgi:adenylosuccinate synthase